MRSSGSVPTAGGTPTVDDLLDRTRRWPLAVVLGVRLGVTAASLPSLVQAYGVRPILPVLLAVTEILLVNAVVLVGLVRRATLRPRRVNRWLLADAAVAVGLNLWAPLVLPDAAHHDVFWPYLLGTVVLWTGWWGPWVGAAPAVAGLPLRMAMGGSTAGVVVERVSVLALGVVAAWAVVSLLRLCTGVALEEGLRAGRAAEQARALREMHDTVLQTLEGIGLASRTPGPDPAVRLERVAAAARSQARELRAALDRHPVAAADVDAGSQLIQAIRPPLRDLAGAGVDVVVDSAALDAVTLPAAVSDALGMGVREALRNVARHAAASRVTVGATAYRDRVEIAVRDDGRGFDPRQAGFGIGQSMRARVREVGGDVEVRSAPRRGTSVQVWVPRVDPGGTWVGPRPR